MTQPIFKSASELNITEAEREAFIRLMNHFRTPFAPPTVPPEDVDRYLDFIQSPDLRDQGTEIRVGFNMAATAQALDLPGYHCGAVACIGGHISLMLDGIDVTEVETCIMTTEMMTRAGAYISTPAEGEPLEQLFYPPEEEVREGTWARISPVTASYAIENFLTGGLPAWRDALNRGDQSQLAV